MKPYKCPVCDGHTMVKSCFYSPMVSEDTTSYEPCRSCEGKGYVWGE